MKWFMPLLLCLIMCTTLLPTKANTPEFDAYVAIISSPDLSYYFTQFPKYKKDLFAKLYSWKGLPKILEIIANRSGKEPIFLDFMVHGEDDGLYIHAREEEEVTGWRRASMGYIVNCINKAFPGRSITVCFESCQSITAYRNSIRGAKLIVGKNDKETARINLVVPEQIIEDCPTVPSYPIYGLSNSYGDQFDGVGPMMYIQKRYHFKKWWVDLTDYDPKGKNKQPGRREKDTFEDMSPTTENLASAWEFFAHHIP